MRKQPFSIRRMLVGLIGIEYNLLVESSEKNMGRFLWAARCVILILILSFLSVYYAFDLMFHIWHMQLLLSLFFSLTFATIYVLLLQTFSKNPLPTKSRKILNTSNLLRLIFLLSIGFLIAKPIEILALQRQLQEDILAYKIELSSEITTQIHRSNQADFEKLQQKLACLQSMPTSISSDEINEVKAKIIDLNKKEAADIQNADNTIAKSGFFLKRIEIVTQKYWISKLICLIIIILFAIPAFLIYSVSSNSRYYIMKKSIEKTLVQNDYDRFMIAYSNIFDSKFELKNMTFYEIYLDPPFRTLLPEPVSYRSQEVFFNQFS